MKNLKHYDGGTFDFMELVIKGKSTTVKDPTFHERIKNYLPKIKPQFPNYDSCFDSNKLHTIEQVGFLTEEKNDLAKLYSFNRKIFQNLKIEVTTIENNRVFGDCQNCTVGEVNSFDHILPKVDFSEYIVHPRNLFPSCTKCNSFKNASSHTKFLNLYIDQLPIEQYLFVNIEWIDELPVPKFYLDNPKGLDQALFELIKSHYRSLNLCDRFQENIDKVITPLKNSISEFKNSLTVEEIVEINNKIIEKNKIAFGHNYWKCILEEKLMRDKKFVSSC